MSLIHDDPLRDSRKGTWTLRINKVPPTGNISMRMFWRKYQAIMELWYHLVRAADGFLDISRPTGKRYILVIRYGKKRLDRINLYQSFKPVIDILRPPQHYCGVYKTGKKAGQSWVRDRIGHGLILEDDEDHLDDVYRNGELPKGVDPYTVITISDFPIE